MEIKSSKKTSVFKGCLILIRPPNLPTSAADIITGGAIVGLFTNFNWDVITANMLPIILASVLLYAGGVVLNDVFDLKTDSIERPERPIPAEVVSLKTALFLGGSLLILGVLLSFYSHTHLGLVALVLSLFIILYDALAKHHTFFGPLIMGTCRGLNLLLGMSILGLPKYSLMFYMLLPIVYIAAVTLISRGEVYGNNKRNILFSSTLYGIVILFILFFKSKPIQIWLQIIPFLSLFIVSIYKPLLQAYKINSPENIKKAVKAGVLSLVVMDATVAVSVSNLWVGLTILLLLPLSLFLSKRFSVT